MARRRPALVAQLHAAGRRWMAVSQARVGRTPPAGAASSVSSWRSAGVFALLFAGAGGCRVQPTDQKWEASAALTVNGPFYQMLKIGVLPSPLNRLSQPHY